MLEALRDIPQASGYKAGDVMVVFGELFNRGYANGIIDAAKTRGMKIIYATVGRRDSEQKLRPLTSKEQAEKNCEPLINIPLEAGFDLEPSDNGPSPFDQLQGVKMSAWKDISLNWGDIESSRKNGVNRFLTNVQKYMQELETHIPEGSNVLFVHTMAGGVPRAKVLMPTMNKVFKGRGDRFIPSKDFWSSDAGKLSEQSFEEVTANTFKHLINESSNLRSKVEGWGGKTSYVAYGYHGTEVLTDGAYKWQTYTPYVQGWAKKLLENHSTDFQKQGISCCVFNCPEILTNSSSIFQGLEVSLYPLLGALEKDGRNTPYITELLKRCKERLRSDLEFSDILNFTNSYLNNEIILKHSNLNDWPRHNSKEQMEYMMESSDKLAAMHKDPKISINAILSEEVFKSTGTLMFEKSWSIDKPVYWLGHDVLVKTLATY